MASTSTSNPKALILLSGGLDSYTAAACAQSQGFQGYGLTVLYGQRHDCEIDAARRVAQALNLAEHKIIQLDLRLFGGSALTADLEVPKAESAQAEVSAGIPITYVPARNTILLSLALGWAEVLGAFDIFIGVNAVDYSGYPDCRPEFLQAFEKLANLATSAGVQGQGKFRIHAPLVSLSKADIIRRGVALGLDYSLTHSCYDPDEKGRACGLCDSCRLRLKGFRDAGLTDPAVYIQRDV
ncbi:MAG: 7-cyano-7-deazaguanine synthase QueC [Sedimentisphaerales bacterium]|nr:7-cyano-7-deazaguanine synthase QueC [Sedimentisphaerales bacterium]